MAETNASYVTEQEINQATHTIDKILDLIKSSKGLADENSKKYWKRWYDSKVGREYMKQFRRNDD